MKYIFSLVLTLTILIANAQEDEEVKTVRRLDPNVFFGGNLGASFGSVTFVDASPYIGYRFVKKQLGVAVGATYQYYANDRRDYSTSIYGGRLFAQFLPERLSMILLHAEFEGLNYKNYLEQRTWVFSPLVGGGLRLGGASIIALWNLNGPNEFTSNPLIRIGYTF